MNNQTNHKNYGTYNYARKSRYNNRWQKVLSVVILVAVVALLAATLPLARTREETPSTTTFEVSYVYHEVTAGDSISHIAGLYIGEYPGSFAEYQSLICSKNGIGNPNRIQVGDVIQVPIYKQLVTVAKTK